MALVFSVLIRRKTRALSLPCEDNQKVVICKLGREPSPGTDSASAFILDLAPRTV